MSHSKKGNSYVELVMIMMLLIVLSLSIYHLIQAGSDTQKKIISRKESQVDARIAVSFINVRLRQNDSKDTVFIEKYNLTDKNALVIKTRTDVEYDTWIYFLNGKLLECIVKPDVQPNDVQGTVIAKIDDYNVYFNEKGNSVINEISYTYGGNKHEKIESVINLRSG